MFNQLINAPLSKPHHRPASLADPHSEPIAGSIPGVLPRRDSEAQVIGQPSAPYASEYFALPKGPQRVIVTKNPDSLGRTSTHAAQIA
jgi:hypothetical protein